MVPATLEHTRTISSDDFAISMWQMTLPHSFVAVATFGIVDGTEAITFASERLARIDVAEGIGLVLHQDSPGTGIGTIGAAFTDHGRVGHGLFFVLVVTFGSAASVRNAGLDLSGDPCHQEIKNGWVLFAIIAPL